MPGHPHSSSDMATGSGPGAPADLATPPDLTGTPLLTLTPAQYSFPNAAPDGVTKGTSGGSFTFTLTNSGSAATTLASAQIGGGSADAAFSISNDSCSKQMLMANSKCTFDVTFTPTIVGDNTSNVSIAGQKSALYGRGVGAWHKELPPIGFKNWYVVSGTGPNDVYVGGLPGYNGNNTQILHSTGKNDWTSQPIGPNVSSGYVAALGFADSGHLYAVDQNWELLTSTGSGAAWQLAAGTGGGSIDPQAPVSLIVNGVNNVMVIGGSTVVQWNGQAYGTNQLTGPLVDNSRPLSAAVSVGGFIEAVGSGGRILQNGFYTGWIDWPNPLGTAGLGSIWGARADDLWACGASSTLGHVDSSFQWKPWPLTAQLPSDLVLNSGWSASTSEIFIVGREKIGTTFTPIILHSIDGGKTWAQHQAGITGQSLGSVWGSSGSDVYAVGGGGVVLHYY
jgi:hypothetical protein